MINDQQLAHEAKAASRASFVANNLLVPSLFVAGLSAVFGSAQETLVVRGTSQCETCAIEISLVARLGVADDPTGPHDIDLWVARDSQGFYYVSPAVTEDRVLRYGPDGRLDGTIGERGQGPGEFATMPGAITIGPDDTIHVFDRFERSLNVFRADQTFERKHRIETLVDEALVLPDGDLVAQGRSATADRIGMPAHLITQDGSLSSFGAYETVVDPRVRIEHTRRMGLAGGRAVWLARPNRYEIEKWGIDGVHELTLIREVDWFGSWAADARSAAPQFERPRSTTHAVWEDGRGLLWVVVRVATLDWSPAGPAPGARDPERSTALPPRESLSDYYDTMIEVIDLRSFEVVADLRVPHFYAETTAGPGLLVGRTADETGHLYIDVWQVSLTGWSEF